MDASLTLTVESLEFGSAPAHGAPYHKNDDIAVAVSVIDVIPTRSQEQRKAETAQRNVEIQKAADQIWKSAWDEEGCRLTKEDVAKRLHDHPNAANMCRDLKTRTQGMLSEESLIRLISEPEWLPPGNRKKDIQLPRKQKTTRL